MLGFGGAITDASSEVFATLSAAKQEEFLQAYYGDTGLRYTLARTTIHSADFGSGSYTYIDEGDAELESFSIEHDRKYRIPLIKRAIETAGGELLMYASPWSPPAFMKDTNNMLHGGKLLPEFYASWANYYTRFIKAYEKRGYSHLGHHHTERTDGNPNLGVLHLQCPGGTGFLEEPPGPDDGKRRPG